MTIEETSSIDALAYDEVDRKVVLLLTDALGWEDEAAHLLLLQDKINAYTSFVESRQYESILPGKEVLGAIFDIHFAQPITENCLDFLNAVAGQLGDQLNIEIHIQTDNE